MPKISVLGTRVRAPHMLLVQAQGERLTNVFLFLINIGSK